MTFFASDLAPTAAVEVAANAPDRHADGEHRCDRVGELPTVDIQPFQHVFAKEQIAEAAAEDRPVEHDAAVPNLEKRDHQHERRQTLKLLVVILDHVNEPRPGDAGQEQQNRHVLQAIFG